VLVTGAGGYIGRQLVTQLAIDHLGARGAGIETLVALDVRETPPDERLAGVVHVTADVRDPGLEELLRRHGIDTVVHLAAIVTPGKRSSRELEYSVDVQGSRNVLDGCVAAGVRKLIVTSSGAAYGYHADNPIPLCEDDALRGNREFAYSDHKRLVEEMLARYRSEHPELRQLVFRPGAVLGDGVSNQISALFEKRVVLGVAGSESPFTFVWDRDVVACLIQGICEDTAGIFNLAGGGATPLRAIAKRLGRPFVPLPAWLIRAALSVLRPLGISRNGPEQVDFLRHRPVLSNDRLRKEFGYTPRLDSDAVFERYLLGRGKRAPTSSASREPDGFAGKSVVLTGAGGGIGGALAHRFGADGARLALLDLESDRLASLTSELTARGIEAIAIPCDVTSRKECDAAVARASASFGGVDVLIANAGITHLSLFRDTEIDVIRRVMEVNFFGAVHCTAAALPSLVRRRGQIVVLSSLAGVAPLATRSGYAASKHALNGFFGSLRAELAGSGVGVTLVCPTFVRTGIGDRALGGDGGAASMRRTETGRPLEPRKLAEAIHRAALERRRLLVPFRHAKLAYLTARLLPGVYERMMIRRIAPDL
jgi:UDP-glucose 4-epimerase